MYANISAKKEIIVKIDEVLTSKLNLKFFNLKIKFVKTRNIFIQIAKVKQTKPKSELINIFYSNNQSFLYLI